MSYFDEVFARIIEATPVNTQADLATVLGIRQASISAAKRRDSIPAEWFIRLHDKYHLNLSWLRAGVGPKFEEFVEEAPSAGTEEMEFFPQSGEDIFLNAGLLAEDEGGDLLLARGETVPVLSTRCDYEEGAPHPCFEANGYMVVPEQFYFSGLLVFGVENDTMSPFLRKGGYAGLDPTSTHLISGDIYGLLMPYEGVVFRRIVQDSESGYYILCFEQEGLPHTRVAAATLRDRLVGRVEWVLQNV